MWHNAPKKKFLWSHRDFQVITEPARDLGVTEDSKYNLGTWEKVTAKHKSLWNSETTSTLWLCCLLAHMWNQCKSSATCISHIIFAMHSLHQPVHAEVSVQETLQ